MNSVLLRLDSMQMAEGKKEAFGRLGVGPSKGAVKANSECACVHVYISTCSIV